MVFLRALRPDQWIKNSFVLLPLVFSLSLTDSGRVLQSLAYTLLFCLASSSVYLFNDVMDRERDQAHPDKRTRPVASGEMGRGAALIIALILGAAAIGAGFRFSGPAKLVLGLYLLNNLFYSLGLKRVVVLDVILIALGFVLRVLGGAYAIGVAASHWLILCTFLVSLFLGFCKRKQEILSLQAHSGDHRPVLHDYNVNYLDHMISVVSACTVLCYALYTLSAETVGKFQTDRLVYTVPFVIYGVFRYMFHINVRHSRMSTSEILVHDKSLVAAIVLWFAAAAGIIYF